MSPAERRRTRGPRALVLSAVVLLLAIFLVPSLQKWLEQRSEIGRLDAQIAQQQHDLTAAQAEQARWNDDAYVIIQARANVSGTSCRRGAVRRRREERRRPGVAAGGRHDGPQTLGGLVRERLGVVAPGGEPRRRAAADHPRVGLLRLQLQHHPLAAPVREGRP